MVDETYITQLVEKCVKETLDEYTLKNIFLQHLQNIQFEEQESLFLKEIYILFPYSMSSPLFEWNKRINEDDKLSLPLDVVKDAIIKQYNFNEWQFLIQTMENKVDIAIILPNTDTYIKRLTDDMHSMGYFCSLMEDIKSKGLTYKVMRFEPLYQTNIREKELGDSLYHLTPSLNVDSIKCNGLTPMSNNKYFNYPNRVYFLKNNIGVSEIRRLTKGFRNSTQSQEDYSLLVVDVNRIPNNVSFHNDPNLENAVYTYDKVPASSIVNVISLNIM